MQEDWDSPSLVAFNNLHLSTPKSGSLGDENKMGTTLTKQEIKFKVTFYHQSLPTSCGSACMLMVGNFLKPSEFPLTSELELKIHRKVRFWDGDDEYGELENAPKILGLAREHGLKVRYFLEVPNNFFPIPPGVETIVWRRYVALFLEALNEEKKEGLLVIGKCDMENLLAEVTHGRLVICEVKFSDFATHCIAVNGFKGNIIFTMDPLRGHGYMNKEQLAKAVDLGYMKSFFSIGLE